MDRRGFLRVALSGITGVAGFFASIPFVKSFLPSAKARALGNPITVDVSGIGPGEVHSYLYRGETMLVLHRSEEMLADLATTEPEVLDHESQDPTYVDPRHRAINPEFLVLRGVCTHLGCVPQLEDARHGKSIVGSWWPGGFICPCHQSGFDYAGRVIRGPAPLNLVIPPHRYTGPNRLVIGEAPEPT